MDEAILATFKEFPEAKLVANRYKTLRKLPSDRFPELREIEKERLYEILFDTITLDRKIRLWTQGEEKEKKQLLSDQYVVDNIL